MNRQLNVVIGSLMLGVLLSGCQQNQAPKKPDLVFKKVSLQKFREISPSNTKAVLLMSDNAAPADLSDEGEILFMVSSKKEFAENLLLNNFKNEYYGDHIEDKVLLKQFTTFEAWGDSYSTNDLLLVYLVEENNSVIGYAVSIGDREEMIQGKGWHSKGLHTLIAQALEAQGINWDTGEYLVEYKVVNNLLAFRKSISTQHVYGILYAAGDIISDEYVVLLAIGEERFLNRIPMEHLNGEIVNDDVLVKELSNFEFQLDAKLPVLTNALVYIIREDGKYIGYILPFDERDDVYQGRQWHSKELKDLIHKISQKYNLPL